MFIVRMENLQSKLHSLISRLCYKLERPVDALERIQFQPATTSAVRIAQDAGWLDSLSDGRIHHADELAGTGHDVELLVRVMRILTATKIVEEVGESRYRANKTTLFLTEQGVRAGMAHWFDNMAPVFVDMPGYFRKNNYQEPLTQEDGPYSYLYGLTYWQRLSQEKNLYHDLNMYMESHKKAGSTLAAIYPIERLTVGFDARHSNVLLVDIGGGKGHQLLDLVKQRPGLPGELVLQDLPTVLPDENTQAAMAAKNIQCIAHNFFHPQPIKGARCYYISAILHDWPDRACRQILGNIASAMIPGYSKLVVNGIILPPTKASYFEVCKDYGMMAAMSAKERTMRQLRELAAGENLKVAKVFPGVKGHDFVMELDLVLSTKWGSDGTDSGRTTHVMVDGDMAKR